MGTYLLVEIGYTQLNPKDTLVALWKCFCFKQIPAELCSRKHLSRHCLESDSLIYLVFELHEDAANVRFCTLLRVCRFFIYVLLVPIQCHAVFKL